jgi:hypothetical protein
MPKNPIIRSAIAIAIPILISIQTPVKAECVSCNTLDLSAINVIPNHTEKSDKLIKLNSGNGFIVSSSITSPFVSELSLQFIEELGRIYLDKCREKKVGEWSFVITSIDKTSEAIENIAQQSTAVKISWVRFGKEELQSQTHLNILIDALMEMRDKETCYVKFEGKQACFRVIVNEARIEGLNAIAKK